MILATRRLLNKASSSSSLQRASLKPAVAESDTDGRVELLVKELQSVKQQVSVLTTNLREAEQTLMRREKEHFNALKSMEVPKVSPPPKVEVKEDPKLRLLVKELEGEVNHWREDYATLESKLRDTQISHKHMEDKFKSELLEARESKILPLALLVGGTVLATWIACHAKKLLDHRETALLAAEKDRDILDRERAMEHRYEEALKEIRRLQQQKPISR
jgi:hypothetical protein